jgi:hypothetical protein
MRVCARTRQRTRHSCRHTRQPLSALDSAGGPPAPAPCLRTSANCSATPGLSSCLSVWKAVGNSRKVVAAGVKAGSRMPPLRSRTCAACARRMEQRVPRPRARPATPQHGMAPPNLWRELSTRATARSHRLLASAERRARDRPLLETQHRLDGGRVQRAEGYMLLRLLCPCCCTCCWACGSRSLQRPRVTALLASGIRLLLSCG